jgi:hypothetical protein
MKMLRQVLMLAAMLVCVTSVFAQDDRRVITGYYSPCKGGTEAEIFSWHSLTQDGKGTADLTRQAFHFLCANREIYAIHGGEVWGATQRWGGLILVEDTDNETCIIYLGMESVEVSRGDVIETGQYLGQYLYRPHITALDAECEEAHWYDWDARALETPIEFVEIGYVIDPALHDHHAIPFVSENPSLERPVDGAE